VSDVPTEGLRDVPDDPVHERLERDPSEEPGPPEEGASYERAVEEDSVAPPSAEDPGSGELAPEFREPEQGR
jgi:hypothetical protein